MDSWEGEASSSSEAQGGKSCVFVLGSWKW